MSTGELLPRNQKALKGFKNLKEVKGAPDQIVGILMRKHLEKFTTKLAKKFN